MKEDSRAWCYDRNFASNPTESRALCSEKKIEPYPEIRERKNRARAFMIKTLQQFKWQQNILAGVNFYATHNYGLPH